MSEGDPTIWGSFFGGSPISVTRHFFRLRIPCKHCGWSPGGINLGPHIANRKSQDLCLRASIRISAPKISEPQRFGDLRRLLSWVSRVRSSASVGTDVPNTDLAETDFRLHGFGFSAYWGLREAKAAVGGHECTAPKLELCRFGSGARTVVPRFLMDITRAPCRQTGSDSRRANLKACNMDTQPDTELGLESRA